MFIHNINSVFLDFGFIKIYYYGLVYSLGFLFSYLLLRYLSKKKHIEIKEDDIDVLFIFIMLGMIIGSRTIFFLVYNFSDFLLDPFEFFRIWNGGMSFHGSLIGICVAVYLFSKKYKYSFFKIADILVIPAALGLFFGRIANFINGELYGRVTSVPWAVKFPRVNDFRHPSQIYEALKNLFMFGILISLIKKKIPDGFRFWLFIFMYGLLRFFIEFFRQPDYIIGENGFFIFGLTMGQILCIPMILVGGTFIYKLYFDLIKKYS